MSDERADCGDITLDGDVDDDGRCSWCGRQIDPDATDRRSRGDMFEHARRFLSERAQQAAESTPELLRVRSALMHAIGFIEGLAVGLETAAPADSARVGRELRDVAIELREQL